MGKKIVFCIVIVSLTCSFSAGQECPGTQTDAEIESADGVADTVDFTYVISEWRWDGFQAFLHDPRLEPAEQMSTPVNCQSFSLQGDLAVITCGFSGLLVVDISETSSNMNVIGSLDPVGAFLNDSDINGIHAYVSDQYLGLRVIDISDPTTPVQVGAIDTISNAWRVSVSGNYAYVSTWGDYVHIVDISDPSAPVAVGYCDDLPWPWAWNIEVLGDYAYVANENGGLSILDVSDKTNPTTVGTLDTGEGNGIAVALSPDGNFAYLGKSNDTVEVIDVSDPTSPVEVDVFGSFFDLNNVTMAVDNMGLFVGDDAGIHHVDLTGCYHTAFVFADTFESGDTSAWSDVVP